MKEWQDYLKPLLLQNYNNQWLKPEEFKDLQSFHKAYVEEYAKASFSKELVGMIEDADNKIIEIKKQLELPDKSYGIG
jgi:DNA transposition AAA+ family ATPase